MDNNTDVNSILDKYLDISIFYSSFLSLHWNTCK